MSAMNRTKLLKLARTNAALSDVQRQSLKEGLSKLQREAAPVTRNLRSRAKHKIADSEDRSVAAICSSLLEAPIRHLPAELLSHVFTLACLGDSLRIGAYNHRDRGELPMFYTLIKVCKYWRDLAFETTGVWNHFVIFDDSHRQSQDRWNRLFKFYQHRLTHVDIRMDTRGMKHKKWDIPETLKSLFKRQDQFVVLRIPRSDKAFVDALEEGPIMANLKKLEIIRSGRYPISDDPLPLSLPSLVHLHLENTLFPPPQNPPSTTFGVQYHRLTRLTLSLTECGPVEYVALLDVLKQSLNLIHLRLNVTHCADIWGELEGLPLPQLQPIVMHQLRILELTDHDVTLTSNRLHPHQPTCHFLSTLCVPSLTDFEVIFPLVPSFWDDMVHLVSEACANIASFLQQTSQLAKIRVVIAPYYLLNGSFNKAVFDTLDVSGSAENFSRFRAPKVDVEGDDASNTLSSLEEFRCLKVSVPLESPEVRAHFATHLVKPGDAYLHPQGAKLQTESEIPIPELLDALRTICQILGSPAGALGGKQFRVARVVN